MTPVAADAAVTHARRKRLVFLLVTGAIALAVVVAARAVMLPFVLALVLAYVLTPLVAAVERRTRAPRGGAIVLVYVVVLGSVYLFARSTAPRIGQELRGLRSELPEIAATVRDQWVPAIEERMHALGLMPPPPDPNAPPPPPPIVVRPQRDGSFAVEIGSGVEITPRPHGGYLVAAPPVAKEEPFDLNRVVSDVVGKSFAYARSNALEIARIGRDIVAAVSRAIFIFGITLMLAAYMMLTRERILGFFTLLARPSNRPDFVRLLARIDRGLSGVVRGQLVICAINGALSAVGFALFGLKYWPVLALVATVFSLVPIFGSIASAVPAVALGLTQSLPTALFVLLWIVGIHQLEANVLNPKIMGDSAKIHPVLVIFSLLVGEHFFHTMGALLAVPCMSIAQSVFLHVRDVLERDDPELAHDPKPSTIPPR